MGIFNKLFKQEQSIERELEKLYIPILQSYGMSLSEAVDMFKDLLIKIKEEAKKEGTINLPRNFGDILLQKEISDENVKKTTIRKRKEGVKDEDIKWWWNMHDLERRMMIAIGDCFKLSVYIKHKEVTGDERQASLKIKKSFPIFGENINSEESNEDKPLPFELKDRINIYIQKTKDTATLKQEIEKHSSFNAFLRDEIRNNGVRR